MDPYRPGQPPYRPGPPPYPPGRDPVPEFTGRPHVSRPAAGAPVVPAAQRSRYTAAGVGLLASATLLLVGVATQDEDTWARALPTLTWALVAGLLLTGVLLCLGRRVARGPALALSAFQSVLALRYLLGMLDDDYLSFVTEYSAGGWFPLGIAVVLVTGGGAGVLLLTTPDAPNSRGPAPDTIGTPRVERPHHRAAVLALLAGLTLLAVSAETLRQATEFARVPYLEGVSALVHPPGGGTPVPGSGEATFLGALLGVALVTAAIVLLVRHPTGRWALFTLGGLALFESARRLFLIDPDVLLPTGPETDAQHLTYAVLAASPVLVAGLCVVSLNLLIRRQRRLPPPPPPPWNTAPPTEPRDGVPTPPATPPEPRDAPRPATGWPSSTPPPGSTPILGDGRDHGNPPGGAWPGGHGHDGGPRSGPP